MPTYKGSIFAKVIRLDQELSTRRKIRLQRKRDCFWGGNGATAAGAAVGGNFTGNPTNKSEPPGGEGGKAPSKNATVKSPVFEGDLLDSSGYSRGNTTVAQPAESILELSEPPLNCSRASSSGGQSIGDEASVAVLPLNLSRGELAARREAAVQEKVKEALEFKQELDGNQRKEAQELEEAKAKHDKNLTAWGANNNEKKNVRNLLTSMHTVLWADSGWKAVSLGDVIDSKKVKVFYRKAMLVVHPDRCSAMTSETRFIAKRVFEAINEAYQEFLKKEGL